jgi:hypothetical protein
MGPALWTGQSGKELVLAALFLHPELEQFLGGHAWLRQLPKSSGTPESSNRIAFIAHALKLGVSKIKKKGAPTCSRLMAFPFM